MEKMQLDDLIEISSEECAIVNGASGPASDTIITTQSVEYPQVDNNPP